MQVMGCVEDCGSQESISKSRMKEIVSWREEKRRWSLFPRNARRWKLLAEGEDITLSKTPEGRRDGRLASIGLPT